MFELSPKNRKILQYTIYYGVLVTYVGVWYFLQGQDYQWTSKYHYCHRPPNISYLLAHFSHTELLHLLWNSAVFWYFGLDAIKMLGVVGFFFVYLLSGAIACHASEISSIGASVATAGIIGASANWGWIFVYIAVNVIGTMGFIDLSQFTNLTPGWDAHLVGVSVGIVYRLLSTTFRFSTQSLVN